MKKWFRLDTAALIFPAVMNKKWSNAFRLTAYLSENVDIAILQEAVNDLRERFPTFYVKLAAGFFWYRLEESKEPPTVIQDYAYPLVHMSKSELSKHCVRVLYYKNRIAVEIFHSITDGNGGILFLKNLLRRYICLKYGEQIADTDELLSLNQSPEPEEIEDSFFRYSSGYANTDPEGKTFHVSGNKFPGKANRLIIGTADSEKLLEKAHFYGCTVTTFLAALMVQSLIEIQASQLPRKRQKAVKVTIPVDLRRLYGSKTLRNFVLTLNIGVDPRQGEYTLQDLCSTIQHQLKAKATKQYMAGMIAQNTLPQRITALRLAPLAMKGLVMRFVYSYRGEKAGSITLSNLGAQRLPKNMEKYVEKMNFILGVQKSYFNNCSVVSYGGKTEISMIRNISETELERLLFSKLVEQGVPIEIESN